MKILTKRQRDGLTYAAQKAYDFELRAHVRQQEADKHADMPAWYRTMTDKVLPALLFAGIASLVAPFLAWVVIGFVVYSSFKNEGE